MRIFLLLCCVFFYSCEHVTEEKTIPPRDYSSFFAQAKTFCKKKNLNQNFFILLDYAAHSGTDRFKIYNFKLGKLIDSFPVSHGCYTAPWGEDRTKEKAILSNVEESHAASKGKYLITERGVSQWGIKVKYLLLGLDSTNNNALKRTIVLHSWEAVSDKSIYPNGTAEGWGCPAISNNNMQKLDKLLQAQSKNTLLWSID